MPLSVIMTSYGEMAKCMSATKRRRHIVLSVTYNISSGKKTMALAHRAPSRSATIIIDVSLRRRARSTRHLNNALARAWRINRNKRQAWHGMAKNNGNGGGVAKIEGGVIGMASMASIINNGEMWRKSQRGMKNGGVSSVAWRSGQNHGGEIKLMTWRVAA